MNNPAWTVRTLSVPGDDTDLTLWVSFDNARFCFGAGEGTQRAFIQKRLRMGGLQAIFLPDGVSGRGGLPGMIMTAADQGSKELTVVGPPDTNSYIASLRGSVTRDMFPVNGLAYPRDSTAPSEVLYDNPRLTVHGVALRPEEHLVSLEASKLPTRPTTLSPAEADAYTAAIVHDMFGKKSVSRPKIDAPPLSLFPPMRYYSFPDVRYPIPVPSEADVATDMVYICRAPDTRGKFDVAKAKELNIPKGPIRAKLTRGETIEYDDPTAPGGRRTVTPAECLVGGGPGAILVVVHCREHNLERLVTSSAFAPYQGKDGAAPGLKVHSMVHRVPPAVWEDARYQAWMQTFGPTTEHYFASSTSSHEIFFAGSAWNALKLNMIDPVLFPVPHYQATPLPEPTLATNASVLKVNHVLKMHPAKPAEVMPNHEKDVSFPTTDAELAAARADLAKDPALADFIAATKTAQASVAAAEAQRQAAPAPGDDIVVTTLGTGSAIPSKYRNVSATYVDAPGVGGILLDCGEGTLGQMRRRWGYEGMAKIYNDLKMIAVSHMHADHHLGLSAILADRFKHGVTTPLYIISPYQIAIQLSETAWWQDGVSRDALENIKWLNINRFKTPWYSRPRGETPEFVPDSFTPEDAKEDQSAFCHLTTLEDVAAGKRKWPFQNVLRYTKAESRKFHNDVFGLIDELGLKSIGAPLVSHRGVAYGLVVEHASGWKLAYSGDTMPCKEFIEAARDTTILIHEATLEDDKPDVAAKKGHSTFGQAIEVGTAMNAKYIILNHFSQRYPKVPNLQLSENGPTVAISFDFMSLRVADSWKMAHYMDAIRLLFAGEEEEDPEIDGVNARLEGAAKGAAEIAAANGTEEKGKGKRVPAEPAPKEAAFAETEPQDPVAEEHEEEVERELPLWARQAGSKKSESDHIYSSNFGIRRSPSKKQERSASGFGIKRPSSSTEDAPQKKQKSIEPVVDAAEEPEPVVQPEQVTQVEAAVEKMDVDDSKPKSVAGWRVPTRAAKPQVDEVVSATEPTPVQQVDEAPAPEVEMTAEAEQLETTTEEAKTEEAKPKPRAGWRIPK